MPSSNWIRKYPHLHLIHAIIDFNDIKTVHQTCLNVPSGRMAVENQKMPAALAANVWHMVAAKWNDTDFQPITSVKATHSDFACPIAILFDVVGNFQPATPEKVEEKWNAMNLALKHGIQSWECSGQGDGGHMNDEDNSNNDDDDNDEDNIDNIGGDEGEKHLFGSLKGHGRSALDLRRNFFMTKILISSICGMFLVSMISSNPQCNNYLTALVVRMVALVFLLSSPSLKQMIMIRFH